VNATRAYTPRGESEAGNEIDSRVRVHAAVMSLSPLKLSLPHPALLSSECKLTHSWQQNTSKGPIHARIALRRLVLRQQQQTPDSPFPSYSGTVNEDKHESLHHNKTHTTQWFVAKTLWYVVKFGLFPNAVI
jgi:hypothetical protein